VRSAQRRHAARSAAQRCSSASLWVSSRCR